MQVTKAYRY